MATQVVVVPLPPNPAGAVDVPLAGTTRIRAWRSPSPDLAVPSDRLAGGEYVLTVEGEICRRAGAPPPFIRRYPLRIVVVRP